MLEELLIAQFREFRNCLERFRAQDEKMDEVFETGSEPTKSDSHKLEEIKQEYLEFKSYFSDIDGCYWGKNWSIKDIAAQIEQEVLS